MNIQNNIARFEAELAKVNRPGMDKLLAYIRKSDFYQAPASTKYHLSCEGGLLQHSLNVLDAMRSIMTPIPQGGDDSATKMWEYRVAGKTVATIPDSSLTIMALLHDICKTYFYATSTRNAKNEQTGKWEKVPYFTVKDRMPLGHGDKSVMIIKQYIDLTSPEMYAIWHHMGFTDNADFLTLSNAIDQFPLVWAMHTADMMASHFMEDEAGNKAVFADPEPESAGAYADNPADDLGEFQEAPAYATD